MSKLIREHPALTVFYLALMAYLLTMAPATVHNEHVLQPWALLHGHIWTDQPVHEAVSFSGHNYLSTAPAAVGDRDDADGGAVRAGGQSDHHVSDRRRAQRGGGVADAHGAGTDEETSNAEIDSIELSGSTPRSCCALRLKQAQFAPICRNGINRCKVQTLTEEQHGPGNAQQDRLLRLGHSR